MPAQRRRKTTTVQREDVAGIATKAAEKPPVKESLKRKASNIENRENEPESSESAKKSSRASNAAKLYEKAPASVRNGNGEPATLPDSAKLDRINKKLESITAYVQAIDKVSRITYDSHIWKSTTMMEKIDKIDNIDCNVEDLYSKIDDLPASGNTDDIEEKLDAMDAKIDNMRLRQWENFLHLNEQIAHHHSTIIESLNNIEERISALAQRPSVAFYNH